MIPRLKILRTKSRNGIDLPLNTRRTVDGQTVEVWGLLKKEVKNRVVLQWWIVCPVEGFQQYFTKERMKNYGQRNYGKFHRQ